MRIGLFISTMLLLLMPRAAISATYYIDFAAGSDSNPGTSKESPWKLAPGMVGFAASYTHAAGDQFLFKGGVTWDSTIAPWNVSSGGAAGTPDYYGVDKTWYSGTSWTHPIFDGGSRNPITVRPYIYFTGSYVTLDSLQVQNIGVAGVNQGNYAIEFRDNHDLLVENMVLPIESRIALYHLNTSGRTLNNITFAGNDISACSWGIALGTAAANSITDNIIIRDNKIHDLHDQIASGAHGDGVIIFNGAKDPTQYLENIRIYNNSFYGDFSRSDASTAGMTALLFCENCNGSVMVYNNHGYDTATAGGYVIEGGPTPGGPNSYFNLYNNSFEMTRDWQGFVSVSNVTSITLENNVYTGGAIVNTIGYYGHVNQFSSDYNDYYGWSNSRFAYLNGSPMDWGAFVSSGYEAHGLNTNPFFVSATDLHLRAESRAMNAGTNLSSVFTTDAEGKPRPSSGPWSMGAYQAAAKPNPPTNAGAAAH